MRYQFLIANSVAPGLPQDLDHQNARFVKFQCAGRGNLPTETLFLVLTCIADIYLPMEIAVSNAGRTMHLRVGDRVDIHSNGRLKSEKEHYTVLVAAFPYPPDNGVYSRMLAYNVEPQQLHELRLQHVVACKPLEPKLDHDSQTTFLCHLRDWMNRHYGSSMKSVYHDVSSDL